MDRFARQIVLPEIGAAGQRRLAEAVIRLSGDPAIVDPAAAYLLAAGFGSVETSEKGDAQPSRAFAVCGPHAFDVWAGRNSFGLGDPGDASPLADDGILAAAGMLLAIEAIKCVAGRHQSHPYQIAVSM